MKKIKEILDGATIEGQILKGYLYLTGVIGVLVLVNIGFLRLIESQTAQVMAFQEQQNSAQQVVTAHYKWLEQLSDAITTGTDFQGSLDPDGCALGQWIDASQADVAKYAQINSALAGIVQPHSQIHMEAAALIKLSETDRDGAYAEYGKSFKPKVETIGEGLSGIIASYQELVSQVKQQMNIFSLVSNVLTVIIGVLAAAFSLSLGRRIARQISMPIITVAEWSEQFATGVENLKLDEDTGVYDGYAVEIRRMMGAFKMLADSIKENVRVIQNVAKGDLTAYVEIKSDGDSLGRNLYHLVQNNDLMFANLLQVADSVANGAEYIASASDTMSINSQEQAGAVEKLSATMGDANKLANVNAVNAENAADVIEKMKKEILAGEDKMRTLLKAVEEIQAASAKVSAVLKTINDIAAKTNILALNASVEAARSGDSGKEFAVIANEVRKLAMKSAKEADDSRRYINDTVKKAEEGSRISQAAAETFSLIVQDAVHVSDVMGGIRNASDEQQTSIALLYDEIKKISGAAMDNAASSQETAATTQQMNVNAEVIRQAMRKFNLRKREQGKAYIPPEKADDTEFIRLANENYSKSLTSQKKAVAL